MSYTGIIKNGVVVLPPEAQLPEGSEVQISMLTEVPEDDPLQVAIRKVAKPRPYWPKDYALNHGHYVSGEPRKP